MLVVTLSLLIGTTAFAIDGTLPAIPSVAQDLNCTINIAQLTVSLYLLGYALGHIPMGFAADLYGRRRLILVFMSIFAAAGVAGSLTNSIETLLVARTIQGFSGACGAVCSRAVARDTTSGNHTVRLMSLLTSMIGLTMIISPFLGSTLMIYGSWRTTYAASAFLGFLALISSLLFLPETNQSQHNDTVFRVFRNSLSAFMNNRTAISGTALVCLTIIGLFSFIATSSEVYIVDKGFTKFEYASIFALMALGYICGGLISRSLGNKFPLRQLIRIFASLYLACSVMLIINQLTGSESLIYLLFCTLSFFVCIGGMLALGTTLALEELPKSAGMTAGLVGTFYLAVGSTYTIFLTQFASDALNGIVFTFIMTGMLVFLVSLTIKVAK